ncbi:hypothetical protein L083_8007 [Actinoplanes sp. N902-109]|nr:hypothetical protein L083_8007 [Actinoplanes sp. N902-109]
MLARASMQDQSRKGHVVPGCMALTVTPVEAGPGKPRA